MSAWIEITGWTLLHFVWQGTFVATAVAVAMRILQDRSPHLRYTIACAGLAVMLASPLVTARALSSGTLLSPAVVGTGDLKVSGYRTEDYRNEDDQRPSAARSDDPRAASAASWDAAFSVDALLPGVVAMWLGGVTLLLLQLAGGCWRVRQLHAVALLETPSRWSPTARRIAEHLGLSRIIRIVDSTAVDTPTVIGWVRPVVLLPVAVMANLTPSQVEAILAHELAHIRRHDFAVNVLQTVAETVLFYHPGVWWLSRRIRAEREHCCDDIAVEVCGDPYAYAAALTEIAAVSVARPRLAVAATGGSLLRRVRRVLGMKTDGTPRTTSGVVVLAAAFALAVGGGSLRLYSMVQSAPPPDAGERRGFGPPDVNRLLGFELLPGPPQYATDDPRGARAWSATVRSYPDEMRIVGFTPRSLIRSAYGLVDAPVVGAPAWMDTETFEITIPSDAPIVFDGRPQDDAVNAAIRRYFESELNLSWHSEMREFPAYALVTTGPALGPHLRPSTSDCRFCGVDDNLFGFTGKKVTMADLADAMTRRHSPISVGRDVVDRTALSGAFDFELRIGFLPFAAIAHGRPAVATLFYPLGVRSFFTALPEQLGLTLEPTTVERQVLVIDHIDRPTTQIVGTDFSGPPQPPVVAADLSSSAKASAGPP